MRDQSKYTIILFAIVALIAGCSREHQQEHVFSVAGRELSCPYLTKDEKGNILLSWVEEDTAHQHSMMYYSLSGDEGRTWQAPLPIPATQGVYPHGENLPKLICKPGGEWIAAFGISSPDPENAYAGLVRYTQSFNQGRNWQSSLPLVKDTASYDQRYFDMALLPDGNIGITWMDDRGKTKPEGSTLYFARTTGSSGFLQERPLAHDLCPCCRTDLITDDHHNIHIAFRKIIQDSIRDMVHLVSTDGGNTFDHAERISADNWVVMACPHSGPSMAYNQYGLQVVWYTLGRGAGVFYCKSADEGRTFSPRKSVSGENMSAKHPQVKVLPDGKLVIVWDEFPRHDTRSHGRIGVQFRSATGKLLRTVYLKNNSFDASFPVVQPVGAGRVLVAYTEQNRQATRVCCRIVSLD